MTDTPSEPTMREEELLDIEKYVAGWDNVPESLAPLHIKIMQRLLSALRQAREEVRKAETTRNAHECCKASWVECNPYTEEQGVPFGPDIARIWKSRALAALDAAEERGCRWCFDWLEQYEPRKVAEIRLGRLGELDPAYIYASQRSDR